MRMSSPPAELCLCSRTPILRGCVASRDSGLELKNIVGVQEVSGVVTGRIAGVVFEAADLQSRTLLPETPGLNHKP